MTNQEKHPVFYALLEPDVACYGFELTAEQARGNPATGDPGWYFVLQEQPGEPKFFTAAPAPAPAATAGGVADVTYESPFRVGIHGSTMLPST